MRRLYVGGLSYSVTEKDLKDRFGKFGDVQDVELRTRMDEDGVPYKTFGYININISDADLKKCLTVLNKSKWKGGTLQIETAKESFLHRLAEERQVAAKQRLQPTAAENKRQKLLDSLSKAGVENFTMKAAVPGTEVPGHKDWVVSKFGRVLPVLQLRCRKGNRARIIKYNPSKYSHNIRKLDQTTSDQATPVCQLTWELQGGDDDISRKRRGEFSPYEPSRPKKSRTETVISHNAAGKSRSEQISHTEAHQFTNGFEQPPNQRPTPMRGAHFVDSDVDSDEKIHRLVAAQPTSHGAQQQELEDDNLEVVGLDFLVKSACSRQQQKGRTGDKDEDDYDSADTDELLASRKPPPLQGRLTPFPAGQLSVTNTDRRRKTKNKSKAGEQEEEEEDSADAEDSVKRRSQKQGSTSENQSNKMSARPVVKLPESDSDEDDEDDEVLDSDSCSDSDYEAMFSNVTHLEISLSDLQRIAEEAQLTSQTTAPSILTQETNLESSPAERRAPKKGTLPEEILTAIMEEDSSEDEQKKKKKKRKAVMSAPLPAFQGTRALNEGSEANESLKRQTEEEGTGCVTKKIDSKAPQLSHRAMDIKTSRSLSGQKGEEIEEEANNEEEKFEISLSSSSDDEEEEEKNEEVVNNMAATKVLKTVPNKVPVSPEESETSSSSSNDDDDDDDDDDEEQAPPRGPLGGEEEAEQQRKANLRRLAAIQQRQKEAEEHKRLIQGALANLDTPTAGAGKHIVFGSDDDDDGSDEDEQLITSEVTMSKKTLFQDSQSADEAAASQDSTKKKKGHLKPSGPQLFGSSEDEEDDDQEEDGRFDIRPQFEGRAGQKLMALQSRFGTDERFRMDSRFLEEDEDKEEESERKRSVTEEDESLEVERKKNLSILESVLGSSQQTCSNKTSIKAKTFRDISALHYDPSKEDHAAFETKPEEKKESKSARRKKREEAQNLPEVSKEIYYDVSGDLKAVFGPTKVDVAEEKEKTSWDQEEEDESGKKDEEPTLLPSIFSADPSVEKEASTGFKFSFFGDETETESRETEYKVESIQAPKVSWQQDPRFHDSSSEEDEDDDEDDEEDVEQSGAALKTTEEETTSKIEFFFFYPEDNRLSEGPRLFCRSSQLEEQKEQWEETRSALRQEYRKKHRDARRKLKSSQKS